MVKININIQKKDLWLISAIFVFIVGVGLVIGAWDTGKTMFHNSEDVKVTVDSLDYSLQEAINLGLLGNGSSGEMSFGDWVDLTSSFSWDTAYGPVTNDGFITLYAFGSHAGGGATAYTDSNPDPITKVTGEGAGYVNYGHGISFPVKKGDYWKIDRSYSNYGSSEIVVRWLPIVSSGGGSGGISDIKTRVVECSGACSNMGTPNQMCSSNYGSDYKALTVDCESIGLMDVDRDMDSNFWCDDTNAGDLTVTCYN